MCELDGWEYVCSLKMKCTQLPFPSTSSLLSTSLSVPTLLSSTRIVCQRWMSDGRKNNSSKARDQEQNENAACRRLGAREWERRARKREKKTFPIKFSLFDHFSERRPRQRKPVWAERVHNRPSGSGSSAVMRKYHCRAFHFCSVFFSLPTVFFFFLFRHSSLYRLVDLLHFILLFIWFVLSLLFITAGGKFCALSTKQENRAQKSMLKWFAMCTSDRATEKWKRRTTTTVAAIPSKKESREVRQIKTRKMIMKNGSLRCVGVFLASNESTSVPRRLHTAHTMNWLSRVNRKANAIKKKKRKSVQINWEEIIMIMTRTHRAATSISFLALSMSSPWPWSFSSLSSTNDFRCAATTCGDGVRGSCVWRAG